MLWIRSARDSLERRLVLMAVAVVLVPTFTISLLMIRLTHEAVKSDHLEDVDIIAEVIAATLAARGEIDSESAHAATAALAVDPRVGVVAVMDPQQQVIHRQIFQPAHWAAVSPILHDPTQGIELNRPVLIAADTLLAVRKAPIWTEGTPGPNGTRRLLGFVLVCLDDQGMPALTRQLQAGQLGVATAVALVVLPPVVILVRRLTRPVRQLTDATARLAAGETEVRVPDQGDDELGTLARSFNAMAQHPSTARGQLIEANQQLEHRVEQRTAELEAANRRLQSEIDDKNEFLRAVTHDLGAPLRNISGMATMLMMKYREQLAEDALTKLQRINANAKHQTELINELLQLSRIRTRPGKRERIDLNALMDELRESLDYDLDKAGITFTVEGPLPVIWAEPLRIRQVFQNLLDNAVKYMGEGPERSITLRCQEQPHDFVFEIQDTGCGIAPEDLPNVFQVFRRAVHSGTHKIPGRGVGLANVKSILEAYSGTITVASTLGEGSTFTVTLARSAVGEPAPEPVAAA